MPDVIRKIAIQQRTATKTPMYIEIVASNNPRVNAITRESQLSMQAVLSAHYTQVNITLVDSMTDLKALAAKKPDLVVLGLKPVLFGPSAGYSGSLTMLPAEYLAAHNINVTGSDSAALTLEFNKPAAKQAVIDAGLQSAAYMIAPMGQALAAHALQFPLFVKPTNRAGSKGVDEQSVVHTEAALRAKVASIHTECRSDALIEEYLPGREFSVAVVRQPRSRSLLAMPIEITIPADANGNSFLSEAVKEADSEAVIPVTGYALRSSLNTLAISVFKALGGRDYGRIDMRLGADGAPRFIEANLMPGLSDHGYLLRCFAMGRRTSYEFMILSIVRLALERRAMKASVRLTAA
jgi:D-alanine-D-alanine ligase